MVCRIRQHMLVRKTTKGKITWGQFMLRLKNNYKFTQSDCWELFEIRSALNLYTLLKLLYVHKIVAKVFFLLGNP